MRDTVMPLSAHQLFSLARHGETHAALRAMCQYVTGLDGYLVSGDYALHADTEDFPLVAPHAYNEGIRIRQKSQDTALSYFGLCFSQVYSIHECVLFASKQSVAATAVRLGLLARALDVALRHLEPRESFGKKTLHHQLVKAEFSDAHDLITRRCEELSLIETDVAYSYDPDVQAEISKRFTTVSKLMGGHGFLLGGVHTIEHLASLIGAIYAPPNQLSGAHGRIATTSFIPASATIGGAQ